MIWRHILLLLCLCVALHADQVQTADGRRLFGQVISETDQQVKIQADLGAGKIIQTIPRSQVVSIQKDTPVVAKGPTYFEIPVNGMVGKEITADAIKDALAEARRLKATHVVLLISSGGGLTNDACDIMDLLASANDLKPIAFVKDGYSAAAMIAIACPKIVMHPEGQIGAALTWYQEDNMQKAVKEKYMSAYRAVFRRISDRAGHDPLFLEGMCDPDIEFYLSWADGRPKLVTEKKTQPQTKPTTRSAGEDVAGAEGVKKSDQVAGEREMKLIKPKGKILTMTAKEAVESGLAEAIVRSEQELGQKLGYSSFTSLGDGGWTIMGAAARRQRAIHDDAEIRLNRMKQQVAQVVAAITECESQLVKLDDDARQATQLRDQRSLNAEYTSGGSNEIYRLKSVEIKQQYEQTMAPLDEQRSAIQKKVKKLRQQLADMK